MASRALYHLNIIMFSPVLFFFDAGIKHVYTLPVNTHAVIPMYKKRKDLCFEDVF